MSLNPKIKSSLKIKENKKNNLKTLNEKLSINNCYYNDYDKQNLTKDELLKLYKHLLQPRLIEEKMLLLLRQNKISKWFSGIGQEAISVGSTLAMLEEEYILPMHRNLGVFTSRNMTYESLFLQFQGKEGGYTNGRDRSFHFGSKEHNIVGMISHLGPQLAIADGIALAHNLNKENNAVLVFTGDGGTSEGDFHEALNVASVWDLPVIFVVENNGWGLSTPSSEQFRFKSFVDKCAGYGFEGISIDGNNIIEVYNTFKEVSQKVRINKRPFLVECNTFRMRGHEESSGTKYIPQHFFEEWGKKDPITNYENYLLNHNIINQELKNEIRNNIKEEINNAIDFAFSQPKINVSTEKEYNDLFQKIDKIEVLPNFEQVTKKRLVDAISDGLKQSLEKHQNLILMGQDIAEYGGVFKVTEGFLKLFGKDRIRNTPLCESAILGTALGLSIKGYKSMVEMQFADFVSVGLNQIVNNLAKIHYRWGQNADVVVRLPTGAGVGAGPFHSQSNESWFFHTPGLKIVYPSNPIDAKGLLNSAINDPNPVLYFEHKYLYRSISDNVPDDYYTIPIGKAKLVKEGSDLTIITYGMGVHWALEALDNIDYISADLIDLRSLAPLDLETIFNSVKKTNKVIILHEDTLIGGIGGEISSQINQNCFEYLDAPIFRSASLDTPVPFATDLENNFLPKNRFKEDLLRLYNY